MFRVAHDPGHGEKGRGGQYAGLDETVLNDAMAAQVDRLCVAGGLASRVIRGKPGDGWVSLDAMARHHRSQLVISYHHNASAHEQRGALTFYHPENRQGQIIAESIIETIRAICPALHSRSSAAISCDDPDYPRTSVVVNAFSATTVLVEYAFMSSAHDRHELARPYTNDLLAAATYAGIIRGAQLLHRGQV